jgi:hypothetical protein
MEDFSVVLRPAQQASYSDKAFESQEMSFEPLNIGDFARKQSREPVDHLQILHSIF